MGKLMHEDGMICDRKEVQVVHLKRKAGEHIVSHTHNGQIVFFTPISGKFTITLEKVDAKEKDTFDAVPGKVLHFDGEDAISATVNEDSEAFIYLITRA